MRVKGESADEMAGFLDAMDARMTRFINESPQPIVVLPSYNGARRLPLLTPLLALLLAKQGLRVIVHGGNTEDTRVSCAQVMQALGMAALQHVRPLKNNEVVYIPIDVILPGLWRLLQVRRTIGLRNSAHSLVKMLNPVTGPALLVASYTHPEYELTMLKTLQNAKANAMLLRGTEGEPVADPRRMRQDIRLQGGQLVDTHEPQADVDVHFPNLPFNMSATENARFIQAMLDDPSTIPAPIEAQVQRLIDLASSITSSN
jgi:anthranilate phosphoribosyltransferase